MIYYMIVYYIIPCTIYYVLYTMYYHILVVYTYHILHTIIYYAICITGTTAHLLWAPANGGFVNEGLFTVLGWVLEYCNNV